MMKSFGLAITLATMLNACATPTPTPQILRLATTTSTADSGLLEAILPSFEAAHNADVQVIAVGTGQALELGSNGDVDVLLVHARAREEQFVADGNGVARLDVMYNDFVIVGPQDDPAKIGGAATAAQALAGIANHGAAFVSRGDDSGTHSKEINLWASAGITPTADSGWYYSIGQGMGETLIFANEQLAYTLTDRGTWLSQMGNLPSLTLLVGGASIADNPDPKLLNAYGVIAINPAKHPGVAAALAMQFVEWITSVETQTQIAAFGVEIFGQPLFYPNSAQWAASH